MSINTAISLPKSPDHRLTKVGLAFLLLLVATVLAAQESDSDFATRSAQQIAEQL